jgi:uncharacterized membrane protein YccC
MLRVLLADRASATDALPQPARAPTSKQRRANFRKTLRTLAGWQFPARLTVGLTMASIIRHLWPAHHFYWIMLTVALLTQRPVEHVPVKTLQRLIGTIAGVGITWLILIGVSSPLILATIVCVLGVLVPIARARSYLLYSLAATPLILLVLDLGKPIETALLADRMAATIIGGAIVIVANVAADRHLNPQGGGALP